MGRRVELDPMGNSDIEPLLKWLNAVYRQDPASRWVTRPNANAYFERTPETSMPLKSTSNVLEAIRGIFQTVQIRFGRLTLNVDTATTAFWTPGKNLIELVHALAGVSMQRDIQSWYLEDPNRFIDNCDRLVGIYFCLRHLSERQNARKRRFSKWTKGSAMDMDFEVEIQGQKQMITVNNYFRLKYNITLKYPKLPMAVVGDSWYPLELCWSAEVCFWVPNLPPPSKKKVILLILKTVIRENATRNPFKAPKRQILSSSPLPLGISGRNK